MRRALWMLVALFLAQPAFAQVVSQGRPAVTSDANAWPFKVVYGSVQVDPRDVSDRAGRILGQVVFVTPQHVIVDSGSVGVTGTFWPTAAASPSSARLSDGASFYDARSIRALTFAGDKVDASGSSVSVTGTVTVAISQTSTNNDVDVATFPDNEPFNVAQWAGTTATGGSGAATAGSPRTITATDSPDVTALQIIDDWDETDRAKVNPIVGQAGVQGGAGASTALTQRVAIATDANAVNVSQFGGTNVVTGVGASAAGVPRVTASMEDVTGSVSITSGAACPAANAYTSSTSAGCVVVPVVGYKGAAGVIFAGTLAATMTPELSYDGGSTWSAALVETSNLTQVLNFVLTNPNAETAFHFIIGTNVSHVRMRASSFTSGAATLLLRSSNNIDSVFTVGALPVSVHGATPSLFVNSVGLASATSTPTAVTATQAVKAIADVYGVQYERQDHPARRSCLLTTSATTSTLITGCEAPASGLAIYITDISVYGGAAVGATAAATIQDGTGGSCGTATTIRYYCQHGATSGCEAHFQTPIRADTISELCLLDATTGTKFVTVSGFTAP